MQQYFCNMLEMSGSVEIDLQSTESQQADTKEQQSTQNMPNGHAFNPESSINVQDQQLTSAFDRISKCKKAEELAPLIKEYCMMIVGAKEEDLFINYFAENKFLQVLKRRLKEFKYDSTLLRSTFSVLEFLLKVLKKDENLVYFLVRINQLGYISERYVFTDEEDIAYYANFLKLMIRKINEDNKYLSVFFNSHEPHFPLLLNLLKFYDCNDPIMHTSSKLAIIQIVNNPSDIVAKYTLNFPFVIFYPLYVGQILNSFRKALDEERNSMWVQNLSSHLKYMEEFIANKERAVIDIYTNTFMAIMGKEIYAQISNISDKRIKRVKKMMKLLLQVVVPELSVVKIKICLLSLFSPTITPNMKKCFESKPVELQSKYWLIDQCPNDVVNHCRNIFFSPSQPSRSIMKIFYSYIPRSTDNWLYHEMRKLSQLIGLSLNLNELISHDKYMPDSFLRALETLFDEPQIRNQLFFNILKQQDEELLHYTIRLLSSLFHCQKQLVFPLDPIIHSLSTCTSLSLIQSFYQMINKEQWRVDEQRISTIFNQVTEKLIYLILTKGWPEFLARTGAIQTSGDFVKDVYRQTECDILFFVCLRSLLGSMNAEGHKFNKEEWKNKTEITREITFPCRANTQRQQSLYFVLDGQYLNIKSFQERTIEALLLADLRFYDEQADLLQIVDSGKHPSGITLIIEPNLKTSLLQEIKSRKKLITHITLQLKSMQLQFAQ